MGDDAGQAHRTRQKIQLASVGEMEEVDEDGRRWKRKMAEGQGDGAITRALTPDDWPHADFLVYGKHIQHHYLYFEYWLFDGLVQSGSGSILDRRPGL